MAKAKQNQEPEQPADETPEPQAEQAQEPVGRKRGKPRPEAIALAGQIYACHCRPHGPQQYTAEGMASMCLDRAEQFLAAIDSITK